jgi:hypothetical protein
MHAWILSLKLFAYVVILLMAVAVVYATVITARYWPAISV